MLGLGRRSQPNFFALNASFLSQILSFLLFSGYNNPLYMSAVIYRIIDANFNRCREAFRVMEEFCRFVLNDQELTSKSKQCRHFLCETLSTIDSLKLLWNRDVAGDVGRELKVTGQMQRKSIEDCFIAACKRASEALRALAESTQTIDPEIAVVMEKLRFETYEIEKKAFLKAHLQTKFEPVRLYILINAFENVPRQEVLQIARECIEGGADSLQLRAKGLSDKQFLALAEPFTALCKDGDVLSIINDRVDIAMLSGADGVHLGQDEISVEQARKMARHPLIIGLSTHSLSELEKAIDSGCDYAAIGPAFSSPTKPQIPVAGLDYIKQATEILSQKGLFHVAIGGITEKNLRDVIQSGARAVAISSAVTASKDIKNTCQMLKSILVSGSV